MFTDFEFEPLPNIISAWKGHGKFAQWIVNKIQPKSIVELGVHFGFSYFCFCQTIKKLNIPCSAVAVDLWKGDYQNGFYDKKYWDDAYNGVIEENKKYSEFSKILRMSFDEALPLIADNSIDLLHIDGCHEYETVSHDWDMWQHKLNSNGVVLFHDTNVRNSSKNFGVWKFFEELVMKEKNTFEFLHSSGLGVMAKNPSLLPELFNIDEQRKSEIRAFFEK